MRWYRKGVMIDDTYHLLANGTVRNEISFRSIDRSFLHNELTCEATNTNLTVPSRTTLHVDMNFAPSLVYIEDKKGRRLVAGKESKVLCRSAGSRPPAHITWYLDEQRLQGGDTETVRRYFCKWFGRLPAFVPFQPCQWFQSDLL